jgi:WD40 repeat protein
VQGEIEKRKKKKKTFCSGSVSNRNWFRFFAIVIASDCFLTWLHCRFALQGHREWIWSVACSPSGVLCSGSQDKLVIAWNPVSFLFVD